MAPSIGVHTLITNPLSSGYLAYLPAIKSWAAIADQVVVVDGGSTDGSLDLLFDWVGELRSKIRVVQSDESYWGDGDDWSWPQIALNRDIGLRELSTEWAIHVDADHVVEESDAVALRNFLAAHDAERVLSLRIWAANRGQYVSTNRTRAWVVNRCHERAQHGGIRYGLEGDGLGLDYPIVPVAQEEYFDPAKKISKVVCRGSAVQSSGVVPIRVRRIGHFFFTEDQCLAKCLRLSRAISRYSLQPEVTRAELIALERLYGIVGYRPKAFVRAEEPNSRIVEAIDRFYEEGMLGGAIRSWRFALLRPAFETVAVAHKVLRASKRSVGPRSPAYSI